MHREMSQQALAETLVSPKLGQNKKLERIDQMVDWGKLGELVDEIYSAKEGRPSYPPLMMVKVLLLEQWYNLSDPQMEEALNTRVDFRRFVGMGLQEDAPDYSTISRFRTALGPERSSELFHELARQMEEGGVMLKRGTLMDATLVEAQVKRPPMDKGRGAKSEVDPDAGWTGTQRGKRSHFGYSVHIGVDEGTNLVREAVFTPANVNESEVADDLISGDEVAVYGDRAYESKERKARLKSRGIKDRTMKRANKHQRVLPYWEQRRNQLISPIRSKVEKVFGTLKRSYGYQRVRYRGLGRNAVEMWFKLMAYNLRRADKIVSDPA